MREKLPFVGFFLSCLLAAWFIGFLTYDKNWFPKQTLLAAKFAQRDWREHWKTYFGVAPTKFFRKSFSVGEGVTVYEKELVAPGYTFLTGFFDDSPGMALIENGGKILNVWPAAFSSTWSDYSHIKEEKDIPLNDWSVHVHGAQPLPDGSVIYNFANIGLVRQGRCGQIMWRLPYAGAYSNSRRTAKSFGNLSAASTRETCFWFRRAADIRRITSRSEIGIVPVRLQKNRSARVSGQC